MRVRTKDQNTGAREDYTQHSVHVYNHSRGVTNAADPATTGQDAEVPEAAISLQL